MNRISKYFADWNLFEKIWLFSFLLVNIYLFFAWGDTVLGLITSITGMICVVLTAKGRISNYYFGIINVSLYIFISFQNKYYGEAILNLFYFLPMSFVGIYYWYKYENKNKKDVVYVRRTKAREVFYWIGLAIIATFLYGLFLRYLNGTLPFVDASSTVFSIIGMILTVRRCREQWIIWILVDIIAVIMWVYIFVTTQDNVSMVVMWSAYLVNACYGWFNWKNLEKERLGGK